MPCYEAPPEWSGDARSSAEDAVMILCSLIKAGLDNGQMLNSTILLWYLEHRKIDLRIAADLRMGKASEIPQIQADIKRVTAMLPQYPLHGREE